MGVIFPIPRVYVSRILEEEKNVFGKFSKMKKLQKGSKVVFYATEKHGSSAIVGEGTIKEFEFLSPSQIGKKFGKNFFLNEIELKEYSKKRFSGKGHKELLIMVLKDIQKYDVPVKPTKRVTVAGYYLTKSEYQNIRSQL